MRRAVPECWCCGRGACPCARGLCARCYRRWRYHGFAGPGPGPERVPYAERARDYEHIITTLSAREAAGKLGVHPRTIRRLRAALREAS